MEVLVRSRWKRRLIVWFKASRLSVESKRGFIGESVEQG